MSSVVAERVAALKERLQPITEAPSLRRVNGIGVTLLGTLRDDALKPMCFKMHWITVLWIPLIPICVYLVDNPAGPSYRFYRSLSVFDFHSLYRGRLGKFYLSVAGEALLGFAIVLIALFVVAFVVSGVRSSFR